MTTMATFQDMEIERDADRILGLDIYTDPEQREAARTRMIDEFLLGRKEEAAPAAPQPEPAGPTYGETPTKETMTPVSQAAPEMARDFGAGAIDFAADVAGAAGAVSELLERWGMEGRTAADLFDDVERWWNDVPVPGEPVGETTDIPAGDSHARKVEAWIRSKVPATTTPTASRIAGRIAAEIGVLVAAPWAKGLKAFLATEAALGGTMGFIRQPDQGLGLTRWAHETAVEGGWLEWLTDIEDDSALERRLKNAAEEALVAAGGASLVRGVVRMVEMRKAVQAEKATRQAAAEAEKARQQPAGEGEAKPGTTPAAATEAAPEKTAVEALQAAETPLEAAGGSSGAEAIKKAQEDLRDAVDELNRMFVANDMAGAGEANKRVNEAKAALEKVETDVKEGRLPLEAAEEATEPKAAEHVADTDAIPEPAPATSSEEALEEQTLSALAGGDTAKAGRTAQAAETPKDAPKMAEQHALEEKVVTGELETVWNRLDKRLLAADYGELRDLELHTIDVGPEASKRYKSRVPDPEPGRGPPSRRLPPPGEAPRVGGGGKSVLAPHRWYGVDAIGDAEKSKPVQDGSLAPSQEPDLLMPLSLRTPDVDRMERRLPQARDAETLADDPEVLFGVRREGPVYHRPFAEWTEDDQLDFRHMAKAMGGEPHITHSGGAAVRLGKSGPIYPLVGTSRSGFPLFRLKSLGEDEVEPLHLYRERQKAYERFDRTLAALKRRHVDTVRRREIEAGEREAAGEAIDAFHAAEAEHVARTTAQETVRRALGDRLVEDEGIEEAIEQVANDVRRVGLHLEELKTADVFTIHATSPKVVAAEAARKQDLDKAGIPPMGDRAPLGIDPDLRGSFIEDAPFSRETVEAIPDITSAQIRTLRALAERQAKGIGYSRDPAARVTSVEDIRRHIDRIAINSRGSTQSTGGTYHERNLHVLSRIAGVPQDELPEIPSGEARAWVMVLAHKSNRAREAARTAAASDSMGWAETWQAMEEAEQLRAYIDVLRGRDDDAAQRLNILLEPETMPDVAMREARVLSRIQQRYGSLRSAQAFVRGMSVQTHQSGIVEAVGTMAGTGRLRKTGEAFQRVALAGMLSAPKTMVLAASSNALVNVAQIPELFIAGAMRRLFKSEKEVMTWRAAQADMVSRLSGLAMGTRIAGAALQDGLFGSSRGVARLRKQGLMQTYDHLTRSTRFDLTDLPRTSGHRNANRTMVENLAKIGDRVITAPFTMLNSLDLIAKGTAYTGYIARRAAMAADHEGLSGKAWKERYRAGIANPPPHWIEEAVRNGEDMTFTRPFSEGETWMSLPMSSVIRGIDRVPPLGRLLASPFLTVPARSLSYALERVPVVGFAQKKVREDFARGGLDRQMVVARQLWGSMVMIPMFLAAQSGILSGGGPTHRGAWNVNRHIRPEYSIKIGDGWYAYDRMDPLGRLMGIAADTAEILSMAENGPVVADATQMMAMASASVLHHTLEGSWMQSTAEFAELLSSSVGQGLDAGAMAGISKYLGGTAWKLVPYNNLVRSGGRGADPVYRDARAVREEGEVMKNFFDPMVRQLKAQVPGLSAELPMRIDAYGRPINRMGPTFEGAAPAGLGWSLMSPMAYHEDTGDAGYKLMFDAGWAPPPWPRSFQGVPYTDAEREAVARISGALFRSMLSRAMEWGQLQGYRRRFGTGSRLQREEARRLAQAELSALYSAALAQGRRAIHSISRDYNATRAEILLRKAQEQERIRSQIRREAQ